MMVAPEPLRGKARRSRSILVSERNAHTCSTPGLLPAANVSFWRGKKKSPSGESGLRSEALDPVAKSRHEWLQSGRFWRKVS
jgi:hypothetical protein